MSDSLFSYNLIADYILISIFFINVSVSCMEQIKSTESQRFIKKYDYFLDIPISRIDTRYVAVLQMRVYEEMEL